MSLHLNVYFYIFKNLDGYTGISKKKLLATLN